MIYIECEKDVFTTNLQQFVLVQCISRDCAMGQGFAADVDRRFHIRKISRELVAKKNFAVGEAFMVKTDNVTVANLITKKDCYNKPTYKSLEKAIKSLKTLCLKNDIQYITMPKIGSGLDSHKWSKVSRIIKYVFDDTEINILVCDNKIKGGNK